MRLGSLRSAQGKSLSDDLCFGERLPVIIRNEGSPGRGCNSCKSPEVETSVESSREQSRQMPGGGGRNKA